MVGVAGSRSESSGSETVTCCAGYIAVLRFSNWTVYGSHVWLVMVLPLATPPNLSFGSIEPPTVTANASRQRGPSTWLQLVGTVPCCSTGFTIRLKICRAFASAVVNVLAPSQRATLAHRPIPFRASISGWLASQAPTAVSDSPAHEAFVTTPPSVRQARRVLPSAQGGVSAAMSWNVGVVEVLSEMRRVVVPGGTRGITRAR